MHKFQSHLKNLVNYIKHPPSTKAFYAIGALKILILSSILNVVIRNLYAMVMSSGKNTNSKHTSYPIKMFRSLRRSISTGSIFDVNKPIKIRDALNTLENLGETDSKTGIFDRKVLENCSPAEKIIYESMAMVSLQMQKDQALQHIIQPNSKVKSLDNAVTVVTNFLVNTIDRFKVDTKKSMEIINKKSYNALLNIKKSYESGASEQLDPELEYEREFLKNLNIMLYMISKPDSNDVDVNFINDIQSHSPTYLSEGIYSLNRKDPSLVKRSSAITKEESKDAFLAFFEKIRTV
ncbi:MAG: hypothetical protein KAH32_06210 [Chlamydiia bacterium]|nr:hypothetical protein [Chlamydiia bacterium]